MTYIYIDESGDLGFDFSKPGTSRHFIITFLIVSNKRNVSSLVKKVFLSLPAATKRKNSGVLHAHHEKSTTIKLLLNGLKEKNVKITTIHLDKSKLSIVHNSNELYNNMVITLLEKLCSEKIIEKNEKVSLIASRRYTSKSLNEHFSKYIISEIPCFEINVSIVKPSDDKCLQAVDFVSWAFGQKYERKNCTYVSILKNNVLYEHNIFE